ncbi:MAG: 5-formyltetrahydrofolate cyclo-ligase [Bacillota bacterium]
MTPYGVKDKGGLRAAILRIRRALSDEEVQGASAEIQERLRRLPVFQSARVIMAYAACRKEVQTERLITEALERGKRVALPVTDTGKREIYAKEISEYPEDLVPGAYGIFEPKPSCPAVPPQDFDLVLVPGVAFDAKGFRLGFGGGYYDRFLSRLREDTITVGLAYRFQVVDTVFPQSHDRWVHYIITEADTIKVH